MLTKNLRTHRVILQDGREFAITSQQYAELRQLKIDSKATDIFQLRDCDTNAVLFDGEYRALKEFKETSKRGNAGIRFYCHFGNSHPLSDNCGCEEKYNVSPFEFKAKAIELTKKTYMQDLAYTEREFVLSHCLPRRR